MVLLSLFLFLLLCLGQLDSSCSLGDDVFAAEYGADSGLPTDDELQCTDNYCCTYDTSFASNCPLSALPDNGTSMIFPGGNTRCLKSYSTPYAFQVHKGARNKLLFYFQGGGSCWDEKTTNSSGRGKKQGTYCRTDAVPWPIYGVFDKSDERNAYKEFTIVNVLYCSGDNHAGNAVRSYVDEAGSSIVHSGAANTESVIAWVQAQQLSGDLALQFDDFVVMGCSAGALASQIWGNELVQRFNYPKRTAIVADSYLGVFPGNNVEGEIIFDFGICSLSFLSADFKEVCLAKTASTADFVTTAMQSQPHLPYLFLQSRYDRVQVKYYNFLAAQYGFAEIDGAQFEVLADGVVQEYNEYPNFIAYFIDSNQHCYTPTPYMYYADTTGINGYASDDDEMGGGRDDDGNIDVDLNEETMNRWLNRVPLSAGDSITSQCADEDCTTYDFIPKSFLQPALGEGGGGFYDEIVSDHVPSRRVQDMHKLPHYDAHMKRIDNEFNVSTTSDPWNHSYTQSLVPLPVIIYLIGIFMVVVFQAYLICRRAMGYNPYAKFSNFDTDAEFMDIEGDGEDILQKGKLGGTWAPTRTMQCFQILLGLAFVMNALIFVGDVNLDRGTATADSALGRIEQSLFEASSLNTELSVSGANVTLLLNELDALGCEDAALLAAYSAEFEAEVDEFGDIVDPLEPYVEKSNNILNSWVKERKNHFIWVTFSLNSICIGLFAWAYSKKSALGLQLTLVLTEVIVLLDLIFGILYMISLMGASDFCMHPTDYILAMAEAGSTRDTLSYYSTCAGNNPAGSTVTDAQYNINVMRYFVSYLGTSSCPDYKYLTNQVQDELNSINTQFEVFADLSRCDTYMPYWEEFFYDGVCSHAFDGMYLIWITQTLCAVCLLAAAMCSSAIFPYFIELKKLECQYDESSDLGIMCSGHNSHNYRKEMDLESLEERNGNSCEALERGRPSASTPTHNPLMISPLEMGGGNGNVKTSSSLSTRHRPTE